MGCLLWSRAVCSGASWDPPDAPRLAHTPAVTLREQLPPPQHLPGAPSWPAAPSGLTSDPDTLPALCPRGKRRHARIRGPGRPGHSLGRQSSMSVSQVRPVYPAWQWQR